MALSPRGRSGRHLRTCSGRHCVPTLDRPAGANLAIPQPSRTVRRFSPCLIVPSDGVGYFRIVRTDRCPLRSELPGSHERPGIHLVARARRRAAWSPAIACAAARERRALQRATTVRSRRPRRSALRPMASRARWYEARSPETMASAAGFTDAIAIAMPSPVIGSGAPAASPIISRSPSTIRDRRSPSGDAARTGVVNSTRRARSRTPGIASEQVGDAVATEAVSDETARRRAFRRRRSAQYTAHPRDERRPRRGR